MITESYYSQACHICFIISTLRAEIHYQNDLFQDQSFACISCILSGECWLFCELLRFERLRDTCCQFIYLSLNGTLTLMEAFLEVIRRKACLQRSRLNSGCSADAVKFHVVPDPWQEMTFLIPGWTGARAFLTHLMSSLRSRNICVDSLENHSLATLVLEKPSCPGFQQSKRASVLLQPNLNLLKLILGL